jgi:hypothetical protein
MDSIPITFSVHPAGRRTKASPRPNASLWSEVRPVPVSRPSWPTAALPSPSRFDAKGERAMTTKAGKPMGKRSTPVRRCKTWEGELENRKGATLSWVQIPPLPPTGSPVAVRVVHRRDELRSAPPPEDSAATEAPKAAPVHSARAEAAGAVRPRTMVLVRPVRRPDRRRSRADPARLALRSTDFPRKAEWCQKEWANA